MKILLVSDYGYIKGGAEVVVSTLAKNLNRRGNTVRVLSSESPNNAHDVFSDYTFKGINPNSPIRFLRWLGNFSAYRAIKRVIKEFKPDIIHINLYEEASPLILFAVKNIPTVILAHNYALLTSPARNPELHRENDSTKSKIYHIIRYYWEYVRYGIVWLALHNVDLVMFSSDFHKNLFERSRFIIDTKKIVMGVKLLEKEPLPFTDTILYLGRLRSEKGIDYLIKSMPYIIKYRPKAQLIIAGTGAEGDNLKQLVHDMDMSPESIKFVGQISHEEVAKYYAKSDVVVIPSIWEEPFGLVGIEAMSVGRPVVATNVGGITEWLIDGITGYLVDSRSSQQIADKVLCLLQNPELSFKMSTNASARSTNFSFDKFVDQMQSLYHDLLSRK